MSDGRDIFTSIDENATGAVTADAVKTWVSANEEKVRGLLEAGAQYFAEHFDSNTADVTAEDFCEVWKKASAAQELAKIVPGVGAKDKSELPPTSYTEFVPEDANFKFTLGHQEMTRVMKELEAIFRSQPCDWLPVEAMGNLLSQELGYEDVAEFEDALEGEFSEFVKGLPNAELSTNERGTPVLRLKQEVMGPPRKMILQVTERKHLWYVLMQAEDARITLPEIEFEFQPMGERKIDTVCIFLCSSHMQCDDNPSIWATLYNLYCPFNLILAQI